MCMHVYVVRYGIHVSIVKQCTHESVEGVHAWQILCVCARCYRCFFVTQMHPQLTLLFVSLSVVYSVSTIVGAWGQLSPQPIMVLASFKLMHNTFFCLDRLVRESDGARHPALWLQ